MPVQFLATTHQTRQALKRLAGAAERIDIFVASFSDQKLAQWLVDATERGAEAHLTTNLHDGTSRRVLRRLRRAGVDVGVLRPSSFRGQRVTLFHPNVYLFDHETDWWTAAIVGSAEATGSALSTQLEAAVLVESSRFDGKDEAGNCILQLLDWADSIHHAPVSDAALADRTDAVGRSAPGTAGRRRRGPAARPGQPTPPHFVAPLSWQELRSSNWASYWGALLQIEQACRDRTGERLSGPKGWLAGLTRASAAFNAGPEQWADPDTRGDLVGATMPAAWLGKSASPHFSALIKSDSGFARALHESVERCVADPSPGSMRHALSPLLARSGATMPGLSRVLAAAGPDRFVSVLAEDVRRRISDIVGFELTAEGDEPFDALARYADAIEQIRAYPWASADSAERSSDHPDEADAWSKRVSLLGCFVA